MSRNNRKSVDASSLAIAASKLGPAPVKGLESARAALAVKAALALDTDCAAVQRALAVHVARERLAVAQLLADDVADAKLSARLSMARRVAALPAADRSLLGVKDTTTTTTTTKTTANPANAATVHLVG